MPITMFTIFLGSFAWFACWYVVGRRMKHAGATPPKQVTLLRSAFLHLGVFFLLMALPHLWLAFNPAQFPLMMALGYTIGHIFLYIGFIYIIRVMFSMLPGPNRWWERLGVALGVVAGIAITVVTTSTMVLGVRPEYDAVNEVTLFNAAPVVGISIAVFAALSLLPAAILFFINGVQSPGARRRSFLLGAGFLIVAVGGPLHDNAGTAALYIIADMVTLVGTLLLASGVLYRFEEKLATAKQPQISQAPQ